MSVGEVLDFGKILEGLFERKGGTCQCELVAELLSPDCLEVRVGLVFLVFSRSFDGLSSFKRAVLSLGESFNAASTICFGKVIIAFASKSATNFSRQRASISPCIDSHAFKRSTVVKKKYSFLRLFILIIKFLFVVFWWFTYEAWR